MPTQQELEIRFLRELQNRISEKALDAGNDSQTQANVYFEALGTYDGPVIELQVLDAQRIIDTPALHRNLSGFFRATAIGGLVSRADENTEVLMVRAPAGTQMLPHGSAVLVSSNVVLTAAHLGATFKTAPHLLGFETQTLQGSTLHFLEGGSAGAKWKQASFAHSTYENDLAVGVLAGVGSTRPRPILTRESVQKVFQSPPAGGARWRFVGFGEMNSTGFGPRVRNHTAGHDLSGWICDSQSQRDHGCLPDKEIFVKSNDLAAGVVDSCFGDSGGALQLEIDGQWRLAGLVSRRSNRSARCGPGTNCVFLGAYREFIDQAISDLGGQPADWV